VSSGILTWAQLAKDVCKKYEICTASEDPVAALIEYLNKETVPYSRRYAILHPYLSGRAPSIGYAHLAELMREGLISTILTTNWDSLLEMALLRVIPCEDLKILVRGEVPDDAIAETLAWRQDHPTVVKLHGDLQSRRFMLGSPETRRFTKTLQDQLQQCLSACTFIVGQSSQDIDVLSLLLQRTDGALYNVRFDPDSSGEIDKILARASAQLVHGKQPGVLADAVQANIGDFDTFFTQLHLAVQQRLVADRREHLRHAEQSILDKEKTGIGYINYTRITELVDKFMHQVLRADPDVLLFVEDRTAPGGMELKRRLLPALARRNKHFKTATIRIEGKSGSRTHERDVTSSMPSLDMTGVKTVLILDSITFSGNTLRLAREAVRASYPHVQVLLGVLVISQQLAESQKELARRDPAEEILSEVVTDRYEIFFPWGVTQTTSTFERRFEGGTPNGGRRVRISRRPWGTIEVLADQEMNSVRLLTIEAGKKLSFQRHLCRDELFVALDDDIGLDICAEDLARTSNEYDEHIKSLILEKGDYVLVPRGVWHRTKASMDRVRLLEVGFGLYDQSNDIERRWDDYDRALRDGSI